MVRIVFLKKEAKRAVFQGPNNKLSEVPFQTFVNAIHDGEFVYEGKQAYFGGLLGTIVNFRITGERVTTKLNMDDFFNEKREFLITIENFNHILNTK